MRHARHHYLILRIINKQIIEAVALRQLQLVGLLVLSVRQATVGLVTLAHCDEDLTRGDDLVRTLSEGLGGQHGIPHDHAATSLEAVGYIEGLLSDLAPAAESSPPKNVLERYNLDEVLQWTCDEIEKVC